MAADLSGTSDPYVVVECAGQSRSTSVVHKTLNPTWEEMVEMEGSLEDFINCGMVLKVYDWDEVGSADTIGSVKVPLGELRVKSQLDFTERLRGGEGELIFSVFWKQKGNAFSTNGLKRTALKTNPPALPVILPHKFDWVYLAYQRNAKALGCSDKQFQEAAKADRTGAHRALSMSTSVPELRRPPSANLFEHPPFLTFQ